MTTGEYAVHYSNFDDSPGRAPFCTVFASLEEAECYAREQVAARPELRCRIYDHEGFVGAPTREFTGAGYRGEGGISARFRRWVGSVLFIAGLILIGMDWNSDFALTWPATIGTRLLIPGVILLVTEAVVVMLARKKRGHDDGRRKI